MYTITDIAPTEAEFIALIAALDAWQETLYPAESNHLLDLSQLPPQTVIALYTRNGYQTRCAFAPYQPDPLSVFMEKPLFADLRSAAL